MFGTNLVALKMLLVRGYGIVHDRNLGYSLPSFSTDRRGWAEAQRVQSPYMVQCMVSVVLISLMVWVSISHMGT